MEKLNINIDQSNSEAYDLIDEKENRTNQILFIDTSCNNYRFSKISLFSKIISDIKDELFIFYSSAFLKKYNINIRNRGLESEFTDRLETEETKLNRNFRIALKRLGN